MPLLEINSLSLGYGTREIFRGIDAREDAGVLIALLGPNGKGKSTLLRTIAGLEKVWKKDKAGKTNGDIFIEGKPIEDYSGRQASSMVSFVGTLTDRARFLSVKDMVGINSYFRTNWTGSLNRSEEERISKALEMVGLEGFEERECSSLSDGEFQRVAIAGALVQDSSIILLDEPTAFLDVANKFLVTRLLKDIAHNTENRKLIIFSTHDLQLALQSCDRLWIMTSEGFFCGSAGQMIKEGVLDKMFDVEGMAFDPQRMMFVSKED